MTQHDPRSEAQAAQDRFEMQYMADSHEIVSVLDTLTLDQARIVRKICAGIRDAQGMQSVYANYYVGMLSAKLAEKGFCVICDKKHDDELEPKVDS